MSKKLLECIKQKHEINKIWPRIGLSGYRGSVAHGTAGDVIDDIDIIGVFIAPKNHYFGLTQIEYLESVDDYDFALFEIRKYIRLLLKSNPNVLSLLWLPDNLYINRSWWGKCLIQNRNIFMSKALYKSFGGYAYGQLRRMTHGCTDQAYQGRKRKERFEKFGYDCKNASHLIRLLRMGIEALTTGEINVARHDAKELRSIKQGHWSLQKVESEADRLMKLLDVAFVNCNLPNKPDFQSAEIILTSILVRELR